jgi:hypothetical protein
MNFFDFATRMLGIAAGAIAVYLFLENRKLRIFDVDEQLEQLKIKEEEIEEECNRRKQEINQDFSARNLRGCVDIDAYLEAPNEWKKRELRKTEARRQHLMKIKKYKWLWSKVD